MSGAEDFWALFFFSSVAISSTIRMNDWNAKFADLPAWTLWGKGKGARRKRKESATRKQTYKKKKERSLGKRRRMAQQNTICTVPPTILGGPLVNNLRQIVRAPRADFWGLLSDVRSEIRNLLFITRDQVTMIIFSNMLTVLEAWQLPTSVHCCG